ncbi:unnamed protein product [Fraxinus pennsylvanica]|uniref:Uncharacterized protein n=1 Tax=Fraxinus pennsylvanica TaxID=56036 RepID=A0AAD1ZS45_9LAMI|nr:unnamed protein product [Fraxinus pennsylvanica]
MWNEQVFRQVESMSAELEERGSKFWKSIVDVLPEVAANCQWKINEENISFWFSHWMLNDPLCNQVTNINQPGLRIRDVCLESGWDIERLHELVGEDVAGNIMQKLHACKPGQDILI